MARKNKKSNKNKKNERELYDLCNRYWNNREEEDSEAMAAGANRIIQWLNRHKNDTAHFKAAALNADEFGFTGLHWIVRARDYPMSFEMVNTWLKLSPETAQIKNCYGQLPLHYACYWGASFEVVMALFEAFPKGVEKLNGVGDLPLHCACSTGCCLKVVMALVEAFPKSVGHVNHDGDLPLHCVCESTFLEQTVFIKVLNVLLEAYPQSIGVLLEAYPQSIGCNEHKRWASDSLQHWARKMSGYDSDEEEDSYDSEFENKLIASSINEAIIGGYYLVVKLFVITFPRSARMPDEDGMLPLHHACSSTASKDIAMVLLDAAPQSATIKDKWGRTPLQLLIPWAKLKGKHGMLPLHFQAAQSKTLTLSFLKFLIAAYPDSIDVRDDRGMLPFLYAFINKSLSVDVLKYFVEMSIDYLQI